jgi:hypothetical protein
MFAVVSGDNKGNDGETAGPDRALLFLLISSSTEAPFLRRSKSDGHRDRKKKQPRLQRACWLTFAFQNVCIQLYSHPFRVLLLTIHRAPIVRRYKIQDNAGNALTR